MIVQGYETGFAQTTDASMKTTSAPCTRRQFLRRTATAIAGPMIVPGSVLGLNGAVAPSNRIVFGGFGIGNRARAILPNLP